MTTVAIAPTSFRARTEAAYAELKRQREERETKESVEKLNDVRKNAERLITEVLGPDTLTDTGLSISTAGWGSARFTVDDIPFVAYYRESEYTSGWHLYIETPCTRAGCTMTIVPALIEVFDLDGVGLAIHERAQDAAHEWGFHCTEQANAPRLSPEEQALIDAHERCGQAHARVMDLEDQRQAIKPDAIQRIVRSGGATSASAAEKLVEALDEDYMAHRAIQYEAEIERWRALGAVKVAEYRAKLSTGAEA